MSLLGLARRAASSPTLPSQPQLVPHARSEVFCREGRAPSAIGSPGLPRPATQQLDHAWPHGGTLVENPQTRTARRHKGMATCELLSISCGRRGASGGGGRRSRLRSSRARLPDIARIGNRTYRVCVRVPGIPVGSLHHLGTPRRRRRRHRRRTRPSDGKRRHDLVDRRAHHRPLARARTTPRSGRGACRLTLISSISPATSPPPERRCRSRTGKPQTQAVC